jgi:hypothetical protein
MKEETIQIDTILFWKMYNALRDAEEVLWSCDGATNPEDEDLTEEIVETSQTIESVLDDCQKIVKTLKETEEV